MNWMHYVVGPVEFCKAVVVYLVLAFCLYYVTGEITLTGLAHGLTGMILVLLFGKSVVLSESTEPLTSTSSTATTVAGGN